MIVDAAPLAGRRLVGVIHSKSATGYIWSTLVGEALAAGHAVKNGRGSSSSNTRRLTQQQCPGRSRKKKKKRRVTTDLQRGRRGGEDKSRGHNTDRLGTSRIRWRVLANGDLRWLGSGDAVATVPSGARLPSVNAACRGPMLGTASGPLYRRKSVVDDMTTFSSSSLL